MLGYDGQRLETSPDQRRRRRRQRRRRRRRRRRRLPSPPRMPRVPSRARCTLGNVVPRSDSDLTLPPPPPSRRGTLRGILEFSELCVLPPRAGTEPRPGGARAPGSCSLRGVRRRPRGAQRHRGNGTLSPHWTLVRDTLLRSPWWRRNASGKGKPGKLEPLPLALWFFCFPC